MYRKKNEKSAKYFSSGSNIRGFPPYYYCTAQGRLKEKVKKILKIFLLRKIMA